MSNTWQDLEKALVDPEFDLEAYIEGQLIEALRNHPDVQAMLREEEDRILYGTGKTSLDERKPIKGELVGIRIGPWEMKVKLDPTMPPDTFRLVSGDLDDA